MRIGFVSDNPRVASGYGNQGDMMAQALAQHHEVYYLAMSDQGAPYQFESLDGTKRDYTVIANPNERGDPFMNTWLPELQAEYNLEAIITLKDPYVFDTDKKMLSTLINWFPFVPVDTEPISPVNLHQISDTAIRPIAIAPNGIRELAANGYNPIYMPLAYDERKFYRMPQQQARAALQWSDEPFVVLFVGANQSNPSRKGIENLLIGWRMFIQQFPNSALYMHTRPVQIGGVNILSLMQGLGLTEAHVRFTDQKKYNMTAPVEMLNHLYNAADVTINAATGGGFELALLESQAVGTPVITNDFTAMRDLVWAGWKLNQGQQPIERMQLDHGLGSWRLQCAPEHIAQALASAYQRRYDEGLKRAAMRGAKAFELKHVTEQYWIPAFKMIERAAKANIETLKLKHELEQARKRFAVDFAEQVGVV